MEHHGTCQNDELGENQAEKVGSSGENDFGEWKTLQIFNSLTFIVTFL